MKNNNPVSSSLIEKTHPKKDKFIGWKLPLPPIGPWFIRLVLLGFVALLTAIYVAPLSYEAQEQVIGQTSQQPVAIESDRLIQTIEKADYAIPVIEEGGMWIQGNGMLGASQLFLSEESNQRYEGDKHVTFSESFKIRFNALVHGWQSDFLDNGMGLSGMQYQIKSSDTQANLWQNGDDLQNMLDSGGMQQKGMPEKYAFYALVSFDASGTMTIPVWYGSPESVRDQLLVNHLNKQAFFDDWINISEETADYISRIQPPKDVSIVYALPREQYGQPLNVVDLYSDAMGNAGFWLVCGAAIVGSMLIGLLPLRRWVGTSFKDNSSNRQGGLYVPLEVWLLGVSLSIFESRPLAFFFYSFDESSIQMFVLAIAIWIGLLVCWCGLSAFLVDAARQGFWQTLNKKSFIVRFSAWLHTFDFSDRSDRSLVKIALAHFLVLSAIGYSAVTIGFYALIPLAIYLLLLVYLFKKQKDRLRQSYDRLFISVRGMAQGDLNVNIDGDVGVFEPMKHELQRVRDGFKHAVDEETKSQRTKSELVTNVSHDLKTPVTAILTYVNLLQQADLTEEDRKAYIDVLSGKSQRLSRLIEDLFEYTRASSGSTEIAPINVDLVELLKQAHIELEDKLAESGIQLRFRLPEHKVIAPLDSEKTFRVFENLYLNIAKYAAPGSRAYVELTLKEREATLSFKNVSAAELDFKAEEITDRFVRGDRSRHTEGSGLGLAIVKSLVELQGGAFAIELDGDLFKAIIRWPLATELPEK